MISPQVPQSELNSWVLFHSDKAHWFVHRQKLRLKVIRKYTEKQKSTHSPYLHPCGPFADICSLSPALTSPSCPATPFPAPGRGGPFCGCLAAVPQGTELRYCTWAGTRSGLAATLSACPTVPPSGTCSWAGDHPPCLPHTAV